MTDNHFNPDTLAFNKDGLIPVIVQDALSKDVLMMAYMNDKALEKTLEEKIAHYYSRKRRTLWKKGETSGNIQTVRSIDYDCDRDTLLMKVEQQGVPCHKEKATCFHNPVVKDKTATDKDILYTLEGIIKERKLNPKKDGYTDYLLKEGLDKILKKVGEEASEVIIAAKNKAPAELTLETADLLYHLLVLLVNENLPLRKIIGELNERRK